MSKIYIVTSGEYSDYSIHAVFSTRALADALVEGYNTRSSWAQQQVEEFELDPSVTYNDYIEVWMTRDGEGTRIYKGFGTELNYLPYCNSFRDELRWTVITDSEERAIKVTNEKRTIILANNLWGDTEAIIKFFGFPTEEEK